MAGKLIVFEGTDGSGKSTQFRLACAALERAGLEFGTCAYPQYQEGSSALVRMYLGGQFGSDPAAVNAYAASAFYAVDRYAGFKRRWSGHYESGGLMMLDRYTTSNAVHQASKLPPEEREAFFDWLEEFEYGRLGLPRPDLVVWLDVPVELARDNLRRRERDTHTSADIHEADPAYLAACRDAAVQAAAFCGWRRVDCAGPSGALRGAEDIHAEIMELIAGALEWRNIS